MKLKVYVDIFRTISYDMKHTAKFTSVSMRDAQKVSKTERNAAVFVLLHFQRKKKEY